MLALFLQQAEGTISRRWHALPSAGKRLLAREILARVRARLTPQPRPQRWLREVVAVEVQAWVPTE